MRSVPVLLRCVAALALLIGGCATYDVPTPAPGPRPMTADEGRAFVTKLLPANIADRRGWAIDIYAAMKSLDLPVDASNVCAVVAVTEQESSFRVDPSVPGLAAIARREIDRQRERAGIPRMVLDAALSLPSSTGASYAERIANVKTERELSELFEEFIGRVPLGTTLFSDRNPIRTGGPMQVSIAFAQAHAEGGGYPYPIATSIRREVFTRRGGMYFGIAHLLGYEANYDRPIYRFADFNAGHYASRNAAFQHAVTQLTGIPLELDGDLLRYQNGRPSREPGETELAVRSLGRRLDLEAPAIRRDLERARGPDFERTTLYRRVMALADRALGRRAPRAVLPRIPLSSPKITRKLTSEWFANRVQTRYETCLKRA